MTIPQTWFCRIRFENSHLTRKSYRCELFYLCSCLLTQFLYRTVAKATFNVKDSINAIIKISITLTINITTLPTMLRKNWWQNHICFSSFPIFTNIQYLQIKNKRTEQNFEKVVDNYDVRSNLRQLTNYISFVSFFIFRKDESNFIKILKMFS